MQVTPIAAEANGEYPNIFPISPQSAVIPIEQSKRIPNTGTIILNRLDGDTWARLPGSIKSRPNVIMPEDPDLAKISFSRNPILAKIKPNNR